MALAAATLQCMPKREIGLQGVREYGPSTDPASTRVFARPYLTWPT